MSQWQLSFIPPETLSYSQGSEVLPFLLPSYRLFSYLFSQPGKDGQCFTKYYIIPTSGLQLDLWVQTSAYDVCAHSAQNTPQQMSNKYQSGWMKWFGEQ